MPWPSALVMTCAAASPAGRPPRGQPTVGLANLGLGQLGGKRGGAPAGYRPVDWRTLGSDRWEESWYDRPRAADRWTVEPWARTVGNKSWRTAKISLEDELAIEIALRIAISEAGVEGIAEIISMMALENFKASKMLEQAEEYIYELEDVVNSLPRNMHNP